MSRIDKNESKSKKELSLTDLKMLFETSDEEPAGYSLSTKIPSYGKNFLDYQKIKAAENILENKNHQDSIDVAKVQNKRHFENKEGEDDDDDEQRKESFFLKQFEFLDEFSSQSKIHNNNNNNNNNLKDYGMKILYKSFEFPAASINSSEELSHDDGSSCHAKEFQNKSPSHHGRTSASEDSFFKALCPVFSMTSTSPQQVVSFLAKEHSIFNTINIDDCFSIWNNEIDARKTSIGKRLSEDLSKHKDSNINICFKGIRFRCHKLILRGSRFFRKSEQKFYKFYGDGDGEKEQITAVAFCFFYTFAMGMKPKIPSKHVMEVKEAAQTQVLDMPELEKYCKELLDSNVYHENEAFEIFKVAHKNSALLMKRLMVQRICMYFLPLVGSRDFIELSVDDVCHLLKSDNIGVNSEIEVFFAAILWLTSNWNNKDRESEKILKRVMGCVRYGLLPPWFSYTLKNRTGIQEMDSIVHCKSISKMIDDGSTIAVTISLFLADKAKIEDIIRRIQAKIPKQRHWIYDRNCTYHYGAHEKVYEAVDYVVFKDYLKIIQMEGKDYWRNFREGGSGHFIKIFCQPFLDTAWSKVRF